MAFIRCWWVLFLAGALFGGSALGYPDEDDFFKKENEIQSLPDDTWFQIEDVDGDMTVVSRNLLIRCKGLVSRDFSVHSQS